MEQLTVKEIVRQWLLANGYDGLYNDFGGFSESCGCGVEDVAPCEATYPSSCVVAIRGPGGLFYPAGAEMPGRPAAQRKSIDRDSRAGYL